MIYKKNIRIRKYEMKNIYLRQHYLDQVYPHEWERV
ncbi:MAG: hypothetical protein ACI9GM_001363 [Salibacteraceae bacterium]|jgi:hypothetical protein